MPRGRALVAGLKAASGAARLANMPRALRGVVFDLDGTLTQPGAIDFKRMRQRCGIPPGEDIIHFVNAQPEPERARLHAMVEEEEEAGLRRMQLMPDCHAIIDFLHERRVPRALLTRNNESAMHRTVALLGRPAAFSLMLSRSFHPPKPAPDALHHIAARWATTADALAMVGDSTDDMMAGRRAGALCICIGDDAAARELADHCVGTLTQLAGLLAALEHVDLIPHAAHGGEQAAEEVAAAMSSTQEGSVEAGASGR
jgi:HAD superfamily hydrolase (TIGR01509 family)